MGTKKTTTPQYEPRPRYDLGGPLPTRFDPTAAQLPASAVAKLLAAIKGSKK